RGGDVEARGVQVARVQAEPEPLAAARLSDQRVELLEGTAEGVAGAGGVLEQDPALAGLPERLLQYGGDARQRLFERLALGGAGVEHDADRVDRLAELEVVDERGERLL